MYPSASANRSDENELCSASWPWIPLPLAWNIELHQIWKVLVQVSSTITCSFSQSGNHSYKWRHHKDGRREVTERKRRNGSDAMVENVFRFGVQSKMQVTRFRRTEKCGPDADFHILNFLCQFSSSKAFRINSERSSWRNKHIIKAFLIYFPIGKYIEQKALI